MGQRTEVVRDGPIAANRALGGAGDRAITSGLGGSKGSGSDAALSDLLGIPGEPAGAIQLVDVRGDRGEPILGRVYSLPADD